MVCVMDVNLPDWRMDYVSVLAYHKSKSPTGKGWPKGQPREHRRDKVFTTTPEDRKFVARWVDDVCSEFKRACRRVHMFSYLQFDECEASEASDVVD